MNEKTTFGPVASRRFGLSLGIDLSLKEKCCNFDCLYCELPKAKKKSEISNPPLVEKIVEDIKEALEAHPNIDVLTVTANGEPTLYKELKKLITTLKSTFSQKVMILSNGSTIVKKEIRDTLMLFDEVKLSLDSVNPKTFLKIDRPVEKNIEDIVQGIRAFNKEYKNLVLEILVVGGVNDKPEEFALLNRVLETLELKRVDLGTIDRPPAYKVSPVSNEKLIELGSYLKIDNLNIIKRKNEKKQSTYSKEEIIKLLKMRPIGKKEEKNGEIFFILCKNIDN